MTLVVELWKCRVCDHVENSLTDLARHMGQNSHGVVVVKNVGRERATLVMMNGAPGDDDPPTFPLFSDFPGVE